MPPSPQHHYNNNEECRTTTKRETEDVYGKWQTLLKLYTDGAGYASCNIMHILTFYFSIELNGT